MRQPTGFILALTISFRLLDGIACLGQTSPATLPDLKLSTAGSVEAVAVQDDGKIIISGDFVSVNNVPRTNIARLNPNGSLDLTWNPAIDIYGAGFGQGAVHAIVPVGTNIYLGGAFYVPDVLGQSLVRVSMLDGSVDRSWMDGPHIYGNSGFPNAIVFEIAVSGTNVFVAGNFTSIGGKPATNFAKLSVTGSGAVDENWKPNPNGYVSRIVANGNDVFVAGDFTSIGTAYRTNLAKLSAITGVADPWDPKIGFGGGLIIGGTNLYCFRELTNIGGASRFTVVKLSTLGPGNVDTNWNPTPFPDNGFGASQALIKDALFLSTGNGPTFAKLDANGIGARDTNWNVTFDNGVLGALTAPSVLLATPSGLFAAGRFHLCNGEVSLALTKIDLVTGARDHTFSAQVQKPGVVNAIAQQPDGKIILGGDFWFAGGLPRQHLARLNQNGALDPFWSPDADGLVNAIAVGNTNVFVGGYFEKIGGLNRTNLAKLGTQSDAVDPNWDAKLNPSSQVKALGVSGGSLFVGGSYFDSGIGGETNRYALIKLGDTGTADPSWQSDAVGDFRAVNSLVLSGTNLYIGGFFTNFNGVVRTNVAKLSALSGTLDTNWNPYPVPNVVAALGLSGTNLFIGGKLLPINLLKADAFGTGFVDQSWSFGGGEVTCLAVGGDGVNLYVGGYFDGNLKKIIIATGTDDPSFNPLPIDFLQPNPPNAIVVAGNDVYVGGDFSVIGGASRFGFALLSVADAPQLIQDSPTNLFIFPNSADGPEVTHFRITGTTNGSLFLSDGETRVNEGDFVTVAQGAVGLKVLPGPGGIITAVSALNAEINGAGTATSSLTMVTNPSPVFKFSAATYSVREGQGNVVVTIRKFGTGTGTVAYATSNLSATGGVDYQTRSGTFSFSAIDKSKNLVLTIADDLQTEGDEQFAITLTSLTNSSIGASIAGPTNAVVTVVDNDLNGLGDSLTTTVAPTNPLPSTGTLTVWLTNAVGQWRLVGELNWHNSGATLSGLVTGIYGIEFLPISGYYPPSATPITEVISAGTNNQFGYEYKFAALLTPGNLSVQIEPDAMATAIAETNRGQWRRQGTSNWLNSDAVVTNLSPGSYTVEFKRVDEWIEPRSRVIQVGASAIYRVSASYLPVAANNALVPMPVDFGVATTNAPYCYNGQIQTSFGFGSGFVVKQRVVVTAAHVLFDDTLLSYTTQARWFFQRYHDRLEPVPQIARGWYIFEGYAAQRESDHSPGISTPDSQNLDAAAMYFLEDAGRGGYGGYLSSDADANEYLLSAYNKFLVGYPIDGVTETNQGKLFATSTNRNLTFTHRENSIFATTDIQSFPGNSGGPLYVQVDIDKYLPAAIYLGGSGETLVRAINSEVVDLINRAEISSHSGGNSTGGGVIIISPGITVPQAGSSLLTVSLTPPNTTNVRPGWRIRGFRDTNFITDAHTTKALIGGGDYPMEFKLVPGFLEPSNITVSVAVGQEVVVQAIYIPDPPSLRFSYSNGLTLIGAAAANYRVEYVTNLTAPLVWTPLTTLTLSNPSVTIANTRPAISGSRLYRAVLVP